MIQSLSTDFTAEVKTKQDALDVTQRHLRAATRELSEQRKRVQGWQARCAQVDQVTQRIRNIEKALVDEELVDWTGRTEVDGSLAVEAGPAFGVRAQAPSGSGDGASLPDPTAGASANVELPYSVDGEPAIPTTNSVASLIRLRRLKLWHERIEKLMDARMRTLQGASAEKEFQCKKIVALCTGVPVDKVEEVSSVLVCGEVLHARLLTLREFQMLDNLVIAVESESQVIDIGRVSGFMQKVWYSVFVHLASANAVLTQVRNGVI